MRCCFNPPDNPAQHPAAGVFLDHRYAFAQDPVTHVLSLSMLRLELKPNAPITVPEVSSDRTETVNIPCRTMRCGCNCRDSY